MKGPCEPTREYEMLTVTQYCVFWKLVVTTFDKFKQENKKSIFSSSEKKKILFGQDSNLRPPALVPDHQATPPPRVCTIDIVKFYYNLDMRIKFTS